MGSASGFYTIVIKEFFWSRYCSREADGFTVSISSTEGVMLMSQFKRKLKKEGEIISKLSHPNIVGILDIFEENNTAYLVMQYIEGESLNDIIRKKGKIDEIQALQYTEQICAALTKIHSKRVLHLDIKPSNILIDEDNHVKLIDFGISKQYDETEHETSNTPIGISAGYSPIEQYGMLKSFLPPTDIYSAGATLYKMLTGQTPIASTTRSEFDLEPVRTYSPNVSKQTEAAVTKAMSEKVRDRFQSAQEFMQALKIIEPDEIEDEKTNEAIPVVNIIENPDDTKIDKQPEKVENPKAASPPEKPLKNVPYQSLSKDKKTPIIDISYLNRWKKFLPAAAIIVSLLFIIIIYVSRNTGSKMKDNITKNVTTSVIEETQTNESGQTTASQTDTAKVRLEREAKAKQEAERLRKEKEKEEQDKKEAEREAKAKQDAADRLRKEKEKEEQDKQEAEREAKAKQDAADRLRKEKEKEEQDKKEAANFLQQANSTFKNSSLGTARLEQSFQLYLKAQKKGGDVTEGYRNFMSVAQALIGGGTGFDSNVKKLLEYAQKLSPTKEVEDLLEKCK